MPRAVRAGMDFISALDQGTIGGIARLCAPGATWWVDTGPDRPAGDPVAAPQGSGRFPLHGTMDLGVKLDLMRELGPAAFPTGCRQTPRRVIGGDRMSVIEVDGHGVHASGAVYNNRYAFVFDTDATGAITAVREYLDTIHAQQVVGGGAPVPRAELVSGDSRPPLGDGFDPVAAPAVALWDLLAQGDVDGIEAIVKPDGTWWTDSGCDRRRGRLFGRGDIAANGPFHGVVPIADKLKAMRDRLASGAYQATIRVTPHRLVVDGDLVAIEASGDADLAGGLRYQNRYLWVLELHDGRLRAVREYCDTLHIADLMGFPHEVGSTATTPAATTPTEGTP
ncbi:MAG: nuclear transport factor 2 family protein [Nocardioidaceae bacterium]